MTNLYEILYTIYENVQLNNFIDFNIGYINFRYKYQNIYPTYSLLKYLLRSFTTLTLSSTSSSTSTSTTILYPTMLTYNLQLKYYGQLLNLFIYMCYTISLFICFTLPAHNTYLHLAVKMGSTHYEFIS